jgi:mannonate dehydratase
MEIACSFFGKQHEPLKKIAQQLGVGYAVCTVPEMSSHARGYIPPWHMANLRLQQLEMESYGMKIAVLEGIKFLDPAKLGLPQRDKAIDDFCNLLENMHQVGIDTVCYNWMPVWGWFRTRIRERTRGEALTTAFCAEDLKNVPITAAGTVSSDMLWENLQYFMERVVPVAARNRIKLALHPDDPPFSPIAGVDRILTSPDAMMKAIDLYPSPYNGIAFCIGSFATMGADVPKEILRFGDRIHFVHMRDIEGTPRHFTETFPDDGKTDMYRAIAALEKIGFDGVIRPDHTPSLQGEDNLDPGYGMLGNLYTIGYLRGLLERAKGELHE